jgi:Sushi repeat (SCR repeat)
MKTGLSGVWSPKQAPVCISRNNNMEPLGGMMCPVPEDVSYASYRAVEGVVTPNGALHGTILEYNCNIGYRLVG